MDTLDGRKFKIVTVAGIIASYVMTLTAAWQAGVGLNAMDPSALMIKSLNRAHSDAPYGIAFGHLYHYLNGIVLALLYYVLLRAWLPGNWLVRGGLFGFIAFLMADVIVSPLATGSGIFFSNTPAPLLMTASSLVPHLAYGVALTFCLAASPLRHAHRGPNE